LEEVAPRTVAVTELIRHIAETVFERTGQDGILKEKTSHPRIKLMNEISKSTGIRDVDGNPVHVDKDDRPFVVVADGQIVYVQVYNARIDPRVEG
jgi:hypothetical protein